MKHLFVVLFSICAMHVFGQLDVTYQTPSKEILDLVDAPLPPSVSMNTDATAAILLYRRQYKTIAELSEPELRLGGLRINPKTNISSRQSYYFQLKLLDVESGKERTIEGLPEEGQFSNFQWSEQEDKMALTNTTDAGVELWIVYLETAMAKKVTDAQLNANMGRPYVWLKDGDALFVKMLPDDRKPLIDEDDVVPVGPTVSENDGKKAQNRTYQDLLKDKNDEFNFEQLARSTIYKVSLDSEKTLWKKPDLYRSISISPDGGYLMLTTIERPFSYLVPYYRFPFKIEMYATDGEFVKTLLEVPLIEDLPQGFQAVRTGMRSLSWRNDKPATIYWTEALDEGDPEKEAEYRDAVYQQPAPFDAPKQLLLKTHNRFSGIEWGDDDLAVAYDYWWSTRNTKTYLFDPSNPEQAPTIITDRNYQDRYSDPGDFVMHENKFGESTLFQDDGKLYLIGDGYSDEGVRPFVDVFDIKTQETERLYQADGKMTLERIIRAIDMEKGIVLTRIESKTDYPNYYFRNVHTGELTPVTDFENPFKAMEDVHKELITYKREDGVELSATLYLPPNYDQEKKEELPMFMWAYPREYKDKSSAGQITSSPNEFTYPYYGSPVFWVMKGYAVLDDAAFPIVGEGEEEPNDSFRKQLVANAKAAIDAVDEMGFVDRNRVAVGGHSYGAFMTANLLSHSDLFAAGIARSGAYNRTLTPFGFQAEERTYWDAPEVYYTMSPFMHADKMKTPMLLIHGEADNNSGTYPMQSERYFNALKGLGATVRLVMLPKESHGYAARESILHVLWEQDQWLEKYVKNGNKEMRP